MQSNVSGVQGQLNLDNASAVKLRELERDAAATRTLYESFLSRFKELSEVESFKIVDARLVSGAERPSAPVWTETDNCPRFGAWRRLIVGLVLALTAELLDDSIHDGNVITGKFGRTLMATLPFLGGGEMRRMPPNQRSPSSYVVERPMSPFAESIRALRSSILYSSAEPGKCKTLAICSALPEEGKTTVALSLARLAAMAGERVLVIDCDQRRGSLSALCGGTSVGLHAVLNGDADYASVLKTDTESDCDLLLSDMTGRATPQKPFQSETVGTLLAKARSTYDLILLDCPPVLLVTEARAVARACDGVVMVARWGKTSARTLSLAIDRIEAAGGDVLGVAINCAMPVGSSRVNSALMLAATQKNTMPE
ncbi:MAG: AAA family ATPase [Alphaproteobacteria bacterium]